MNAALARCLWLMIAFVCCSATHKLDCPEVCVLNDVQCVTKGAFDVYKSVIAGLNGQLTPMDPLHIDAISDKNNSITYSLFNIELEGLKNCIITRLRLNASSRYYKHYIHCPILNSTFNLEVRNTTDELTSYDKVIINADDYNILNKGDYGVFVKKKDNQPHFFIKSVRSGVYAKGKLDITSSCDVDGQNPNEVFGNSNRQVTAGYLLSIIVKRAMKVVLFDGIDFFIRSHLMGEVLPAASGNETVCYVS